MTPSLLASTSFPGPGAGLLRRGAASRVAGGRDGGEPFYVEGCGCGGVCGGRGRRAASACAGAPGPFPCGASPGHAGTTAVRGELAELPEDVELPPGWNSPFSAQWMLRHGGPVTLPERDEGNFLTPRGDAESDESGGLTPRWTEGEEDQYCGCETPLITADDQVKAEEYFDLRPSCDNHRWLINAAWTTLLENLDLVEGAAAVYRRSAMTDLSNQVLGREFSIIYWEDRTRVQCWASDSIARYSYDDNELTLGIDPYLQGLEALLAAANAATGSDKRKGRACVAADLAATILHELVHAAGFARGDNADRGRASYEIENYFRYYVMRRLCVLGWGCCNWATGDAGNYDLLVGDPGFNSDSYYVGSSTNSCVSGDEGC